MTAVRDWTSRLGERSPPHFNQLVIWLLLACGMLLACWPFEYHTGERQTPVTLLSWLPAAVLANPWTPLLFRGLLIVGGLLWC